ncbi:MAG: DUF481 domain-containing protein [Gammaproteobacteria bacterium]
MSLPVLPSVLRRCVLALVSTVALQHWPAEALAAKTDVVFLENGDRITGEFKRLERGQLVWSTDSMGTLSIEWADVAGIRSRFRLQAELASGARYVGFAPPAEGSGRIRLGDFPDSEDGPELLMTRVVRINRLDEGNLIDRSDGYVNFGYDYTKATSITTLRLAAGIGARRDDFSWNVDGSLRVTDSAGESSSERALLGGVFTRFLADRWYRRYILNFERNDELGLDLRTLAGGLGGRYLLQTNQYEWSLLGGLALTREEFEDAGPAQNLELVFGTDFAWYLYNFPKTDVTASVYVLPSLTDGGRYRAQSDVRARRELVSDLFFELSFYGTYDSEPGESADTDFDYGVTSSLGYSF